MGWFYPPPPASQGASSSTPPLPHDPIPAQGTSPPPLRQAALAVTMVAVLASWPSDLEPRLQRPNAQRTSIAPLTLTYGQQPPRYSIAGQMAQIAGIWPTDLEPRLTRPNEQQQKIAPLTLAYGNQRINPPLSSAEIAKIVSIWPPTEVGPALPYPNWARKAYAATLPPPLTAYVGPGPTGAIYPAILQAAFEPLEIEVVAGFVLAPDNPDQPPRQFPLHPRTQAQIAAAWIDPAPQPPVPTHVAPITLPAGTPPTPQGPLTVTEVAQLVASWPADLEPRLGRPNANRQQIAPLTLPTGTAPIPSGPLSVPEVLQFNAAWQQGWDAQTAPRNGWNVPPLATYVPPARLPDVLFTPVADVIAAPRLRPSVVPSFAAVSQPQPQPPLSVLELAQIVAAWPIDVGPQQPWPLNTPAKIAPLTLPTGIQPTPQPPLSVLKVAQIVSTWAVSWDAQSAPKNASWNVPPILSWVSPTPVPAHVYAAWQPPAPPPVQRLQSVVPTFTAVDQPPVRGARIPAPIVSAWADGGATIIALPPASAAWSIVPTVVPAPTVLPGAILAAWLEPTVTRQPRVQIAPLTLATGAAPPPRAPLSVSALTASVASWQQTWDAQTATKSAAWNIPSIPLGVPPVPRPRHIWTAWEVAQVWSPLPVMSLPVTGATPRVITLATWKPTTTLDTFIARPALDTWE
jgi:hypothetical protein